MAQDPSMADKEAVLASLNLNAMTFNKFDSQPVDFGPSDQSTRRGIYIDGRSWKLKIFTENFYWEFLLFKGEVYGTRVRMVLTEVSTVLYMIRSSNYLLLRGSYS